MKGYDMTLFAYATDDNAELGGSMSELTHALVAVKPLKRELVEIGTKEFGKSPALRVQIIDLAANDGAGEDAGIRLLFWTTAQRQVLEATKNAEWAVGRFEEQPQANDPSKTVYLFVPPNMDEIDPSQIATAITNVSVGAPF